jgi:putative salt-induced outer membrane protein YdiY
MIAGVAASMATAAWAQATNPVPAAAPEPLWKTIVTAGANITRGNSETMVLNGSVISVFKRDKNEARVGAEVNYGEAERTTGSGTIETKTTDTNINNARAFGEYRHLLDERTFLYGNAELLRDDIADIDHRLTVGPGVGRYFLMSNMQKLSGEIGATYIRTKLAAETDGTVALRLAERYELKLGATASLWESVEYLPSFDDFSQFLMNSEIGAEAAMNAHLSLRVVFQDKYNSDPAPDKDNNDLVLIAGLSYRL